MSSSDDSDLYTLIENSDTIREPETVADEEEKDDEEEEKEETEVQNDSSSDKESNKIYYDDEGDEFADAVSSASQISPTPSDSLASALEVFVSRVKKRVTFNAHVYKRFVEAIPDQFQWGAPALDVIENIHYTASKNLHSSIIQEEGYYKDPYQQINPSVLAIFPCLAGLYALILALLKRQWSVTTVQAASGLRVRSILGILYPIENVMIADD